MSSLWAPNGPGDDRTGLNNFQYNQEFDFEYLNFSTRLDWNLNDKWKTFARVSRFQTDQGQPDFTGGVDQFKMRPAQGSKRNGWNIAADTVYTMSSTTALNVRAAYYQVEDKRDYPDMALGPATCPTCGRTLVPALHGWAARFCISPKSTWGTTAPTAWAARGGRFPRATACTPASTSTCRSTRSSRAPKCASSAAKRRASATSTSRSTRTRRRTPRRART